MGVCVFHHGGDGDSLLNWPSVPQPDTRQVCPGVKACEGAGRHTGWMKGLKDSGVSSSSTVTSLSVVWGL